MQLKFGSAATIFFSFVFHSNTFFIHGATSRLHDYLHTHTTVDRTPLDEWSARRRDLFLTTHNIHKRQSCPWRDSNPQSQQASWRTPTP